MPCADDATGVAPAAEIEPSEGRNTMTPKYAALKAALLGSALTLSTVGYAQEIKIGFNGDLSASPSAQSGQAGVLGIQAAIEDINAAGGILGRKLALVVRDDL